jgi:hypothetical protein
MRKCEYNNSALKFKIDGMSALFGVPYAIEKLRLFMVKFERKRKK